MSDIRVAAQLQHCCRPREPGFSGWPVCLLCSQKILLCTGLALAHELLKVGLDSASLGACQRQLGGSWGCRELLGTSKSFQQCLQVGAQLCAQGDVSDCSVELSVLLNPCHMAWQSPIRDWARAAQLSPLPRGFHCFKTAKGQSELWALQSWIWGSKAGSLQRGWLSCLCSRDFSS